MSSNDAAEGKASPSNRHRPPNTPFRQQRLPAWQPVMSPPYVIGCLSITGVVFLIIGGLIIAESDSLVELEFRYDQLEACPWSARLPSLGYACPPLSLDFTLTKTLKAPIFIYYRIQGIYQNQRSYARSKSDEQLSGIADPTSTVDCVPLQRPGEYANVGGNVTARLSSGRLLDVRTLTYNPCGLIPWSMFNDSFVLSRVATDGSVSVLCNGEAFDAAGNPTMPNETQYCVKRGIAWPSDPGVRFVAPPLTPTTLTALGIREACLPPSDADNGTQWNPYLCRGWYLGEEGHRIPYATDEDLMVWVRISSMSTFRKLYRRITVDLPPGQYRLDIFQRYDISAFGGKKAVLLATTGWIGGQNYFLGALYIVTGALSFVVGVGFGIKYRLSRRLAVSL